MENAGKMVHMVKVKVKDCPKVTIEGKAYRDVTELLYEDTKYRKTYPTREEWAKIRAYELRKARVKDNRKVVMEEDGEEKRTKIGFQYTEEAEQRMIEMAKAGETDHAIAKAVGTNRRSVYMKLRDLRKRGVDC